MIVYNIYSVARLETAAGGGVTTGTDVSTLITDPPVFMETVKSDGDILQWHRAAGGW